MKGAPNMIPGGKADNKKPSDFDPEQLKKGIRVEMEHTDNPELAREIAMDHLAEFSNYYNALGTMERQLEEKKPVKVAMASMLLKWASEDDDEGSSKVSPQQRAQIEEYLRAHSVTDDEKFHDFAESIGVSPHAAEPIAYQMAHNLSKKAEPMNNFMNGFGDELTKTAGSPVLRQLSVKGQSLGRKVKGLMARALKRARKARGQTRRGAGLKGLLGKKAEATALPAPAPTAPAPAQKPPPAQKMPAPMKPPTVGGPAPALKPPGQTMEKKIAMAQASDKAGRKLKEVVDQAQAGAHRGQKTPTNEQTQFGGGTGNFKGKKAPSFTSSTKGGQLGNPTENPDRFGCGSGTKVAGIGSKLMLGAAGIPVAAALGTVAHEEAKAKGKGKKKAAPPPKGATGYFSELRERMNRAAGK